MLTKKIRWIFNLCAVFLLMSAPAHASAFKYEVTITNITKGIIFTPPIVATTKFNQNVTLFEVGSPASEELAMIAEGGQTGPMASYLERMGVPNVVQHPDPILPGQSVVIEIGGWVRGELLLASMLLPTNDGFIASNGETIKGGFRGQTFYLRAYDSGTEENSEICSEIPGPQCQGEGFTEDPGEGYVYPHPGIHGESELSREAYEFSKPVVKVTVQRKR